PRKTTATAQSLYHRFHLFFPRKDFNYFDVSLAALYVSTKMHDTLKKPRELLAVSYGIKYPELVGKSKSPSGEVDLDTMDANLVEQDRQRLLAVERLILETICFTSHPACFPKSSDRTGSKRWGSILFVTKLTKLAWRLAIDSHRTLVPIQYPPHTVALGSIYVAALLSSFESDPNSPEARNGHDIAQLLKQHGPWEGRFHSHVEDLEGGYCAYDSRPSYPRCPESFSKHLPADTFLAFTSPFSAESIPFL
ncbi:hypothetical protein MPER_08601, partial [Moniliophthora perniciosa FA553]